MYTSMNSLYKTIALKLDQRRREITQPLLLPGEFELAREFGTSRETIRRALKRLEEEGALTRRRGIGSYLHPINSGAGKLTGRTVGIVPPLWMDTDGAWYSSVIYEGINRWAGTNDCHFTILHMHSKNQNIDQWLAGVRKLEIAGLVWIHPQTSQLELLRTAARQIPSVVLGRIIPGENLHHVIPDYDAMAMLLDNHLVAHGRNTYAVIGKNVYDPMTQMWIESVTKAHLRRKAVFNPAFHHFDYQCFHLTQLADLILDYYLKAHPEVQALIFPSSGSLRTLLANYRFRSAIENGLAIVTTDYGPYPIEDIALDINLTYIDCNWSSIAYKAMILLSQIVAGHRPAKTLIEPVKLVEGHPPPPPDTRRKR